MHGKGFFAHIFSPRFSPEPGELCKLHRGIVPLFKPTGKVILISLDKRAGMLDNKTVKQPTHADPKTLLEQILANRARRHSEDVPENAKREEEEVLVAWVMGRVESFEARAVLDVAGNAQLYSRVAQALHDLYAAGRIAITWKSKITDVLRKEARL